MSDFQQQLQSILGDPEAMEQITAIARALTGPGAPSSPPDTPEQGPGPEHSSDFIPVSSEPEQAAPGTAGQPPDLSALLSAFGGNDGTDARLLPIFMEVLSAYQAEDNDRAALLTALKPFLSPARQARLEQAERLTRLARAIRTGYRLWQEEPHV